jgi:HPt (histidine-containing phosphotransfer) domain-containing protein
VKPDSSLSSQDAENVAVPEPMIDWVSLSRHFEGNEGLIEQLIDLTLRTQAEIPSQLSQAADRLDWEGMARSAHDLKSLSGHFQVWALVELAKTTERAARERQPTAPQLARALATGADQLMGVLAAYRGAVTQTPDPAAAIDLASELHAFAEALRGRQMAAYHLAERLQPHLSDDELRPALERAIRAALDLEFAVALSYLEPALAAIEAGGK